MRSNWSSQGVDAELVRLDASDPMAPRPAPGSSGRNSWPCNRAALRLFDKISAGLPTRLTRARRHRDPGLVLLSQAWRTAAVVGTGLSASLLAGRAVGVGDEQRPQRGRRWRRRHLWSRDLWGPGVLLAAGRRILGTPAGGGPGPVLAGVHGLCGLQGPRPQRVRTRCRTGSPSDPACPAWRQEGRR